MVTLFSEPAGVLQLMEIGDVQKKDIVDHPENYTLLTTLDEGLSRDGTGFIFPGSRFVTMVHSVSEMWRKFKEEGGGLSKASGVGLCEDGIREMVTFLNPRQTGACSP